MLSSTARFILLLQSVAPLALGIALPGGEAPSPPEEPEPPFRACAPFCRNPTYRLAEPDIYPNRDTWIINIGRPGLYQSETNPDINNVLGTYLKESLPYFLNQIVSDNKTVPALVTAGSPLLIDAVVAIAKETDVAPNAAKLKAWATSVDPKAPCDAFAAAAVPINSVVGDTVYFANPREGKATTHEQDYFLQPAYGPISHRDDILIHYKSKFPAFWGTTPTTNIDRNVYVRSSETCAKYSSGAAGHAAFEAQIKDLLTQFGQLKQWAVPDVDYIDTIYQIRYLKAYCLAGFTFKKNAFEKAISADSHGVDKLLLSDPIGKTFFTNWTKLNLFASLGLPKDRAYTPALAAGATCSQATQIYTLKFEKGSLQVKKCGACARTVIGYTTGAWVGTGC